MGAQVARGLVESVNDGLATLEQAVTIHMQSNLFPPPPSYMVPVAVKAIKRWKLGDHTRIKLPGRVTYNGERYVSPIAVIRSFRLEEFVRSDEAEE